MMTLKGHHYAIPDLVRGAAVLSMVAYHAVYDWVYVFGQPLWWFPSTLSFFWQQSIGCVFLFVAGISLGLSKSGWRHGGVIFGVAVLLSVVTILFMPTQRIQFGVLHCIGIAILVISTLRPLFKDIPDLLGLYLSMVLFFFTWPQGSLSLAGRFLQPPTWLGWLRNPLGWPQAGFFSADYYPLMPWFFLILAGFFFARRTTFRKRVSSLPFSWLRGLAFIGQHALLIYLLHQPLILLCLMLIQ